MHKLLSSPLAIILSTIDISTMHPEHGNTASFHWKVNSRWRNSTQTQTSALQQKIPSEFKINFTTFNHPRSARSSVRRHLIRILRTSGTQLFPRRLDSLYIYIYKQQARRSSAEVNEPRSFREAARAEEKTEEKRRDKPARRTGRPRRTTRKIFYCRRRNNKGEFLRALSNATAAELRE